jgi:predicted DNA-binding transcriptional regulator AlpA
VSLLNLNQVAQRLGISEKTLRNFKGELPGAVRVGRRIKYQESDITDFIRRGGCRPAVQSAA